MVSFCNNGDESLGSINAGNYLTSSATILLSRKILHRGIIIIIIISISSSDRLCGLVVRVSGYRCRGPGFDPRRYQIF